ncbi:Chaperonin-like RBCX protein 1 [Hirschfeldia incana]|nr:Chaperonin-like RBCX protein 1 [Hirschfeldia incana]
MESSSSSLLHHSYLSHFNPPKLRKLSLSYPSMQKCRNRKPTRICSNKMYVPGFGEASPEAKAAKHLHDFFTYVAVRIVSSQLESYNPEAYMELREFLDTNSVSDGDKFCAALMRRSSRHMNLALRILEVRSAYCKNDFEWDNLQRLAFKNVDRSNTKLMREYVLETSHVETDPDK